MPTIVVKGNPIAKKRPRFARVGKFVRTYSDQETEAGRFLLEAKQQWHRNPYSGPVSLRLLFFMRRPKGHYGSGRNSRVLKAWAPTRHTSKPDLDNMVKFVKDCLNGCCWADDSQVCFTIASKVYDEDPRTVIEIEEIQETDCRMEA